MMKGPSLIFILIIFFSRLIFCQLDQLLEEKKRILQTGIQVLQKLNDDQQMQESIQDDTISQENFNEKQQKSKLKLNLPNLNPHTDTFRFKQDSNYGLGNTFENTFQTDTSELIKDIYDNDFKDLQKNRTQETITNLNKLEQLYQNNSKSQLESNNQTNNLENKTKIINEQQNKILDENLNKNSTQSNEKLFDTLFNQDRNNTQTQENYQQSKKIPEEQIDMINQNIMKNLTNKFKDIDNLKQSIQQIKNDIKFLKKDSKKLEKPKDDQNRNIQLQQQLEKNTEDQIKLKYNLEKFTNFVQHQALALQETNQMKQNYTKQTSEFIKTQIQQIQDENSFMNTDQSFVSDPSYDQLIEIIQQKKIQKEKLIYKQLQELKSISHMQDQIKQIKDENQFHPEKVTPIEISQNESTQQIQEQIQKLNSFNLQRQKTKRTSFLQKDVNYKFPIIEQFTCENDQQLNENSLYLCSANCNNYNVCSGITHKVFLFNQDLFQTMINENYAIEFCDKVNQLQKSMFHFFSFYLFQVSNNE